MKIQQNTVSVKAPCRGYHLITDDIIRQMPELRDFTAGLAHLQILHTSAGLTINENADPTVRYDFETFFNLLVPENSDIYRHTMEGTDDMTSHIKASLLGSSVTIPVTQGDFKLGTWQGIYLCEFRNRPLNRNIIITIIGE